MRPGGRVSDPELLQEAKPTYTESAMRQKIEGHVELEAIVGIDGSVTQVRVTKSLDRQFGLDAAAIQAARQWKFKPGTFEGKPVPVLVTLILEFRLNR
jgi:protein TonB